MYINEPVVVIYCMWYDMYEGTAVRLADCYGISYGDPSNKQMSKLPGLPRDSTKSPQTES